MSAPDKGEAGGVELAKVTNNSAGNLNSSIDEGQGRINTKGSHAGENGEQKVVKNDEGNLKSDFFPTEQQVEVKQGFLQRCRARCCSCDNNKKQPGIESNPNARVKNTIKRIVNGRFVLTIMTFVTIFALIGVSIFISTISNSNFDFCNCYAS